MSEEKTVHDLFVEELQDIYHAEKQLCKALPKQAKAASNQELKDCISEHLEETYRQCERLEQIFEELGMRAKAKPCEAMRGLLEEASEMMREDFSGEVMDVALVSCAQKVEHYEIASYGTLVALAEAMGHESIVSLLQETLEEEKHTDEKLTELAQSEINPAAMESFASSAAQNRGKPETGMGNFNRGRRERYAEMQRATDQAPRQAQGRKTAKKPGRPRSQTSTAAKPGRKKNVAATATRSTRRAKAGK